MSRSLTSRFTARRAIRAGVRLRAHLEPGKVADVVVLDGDALDLRDLAGRVRRVYQDGTLVSEGSSTP